MTMTRYLTLCALSALVACGTDGADSSNDDGFVDGQNGGNASPDADNDEDGFTNGEESDAGTDPDNAFSRPYEGGYNVAGCETEPVATGPTGTARLESSGQTYEWPTLVVGDIPENFTLMDQYGEMVDLYSFCGKHIMVAMSAGWCAPCRALARDMQPTQDTYRDNGLQILEIITDDNAYNQPDLNFLQGWADYYNFDDIPVLQMNALDADGDGYTDSLDHLYFWFDADGYIPSVYHIGPDMKVVSADASIYDPGSFL